MSSVSFAAVGAIWILWAAHFNMSIAVWVGMIAPLGVAAETASVMVVYLDDAWKEGRDAGNIKTVDDLVAQSLEAASRRVRPLLAAGSDADRRRGRVTCPRRDHAHFGDARAVTAAELERSVARPLLTQAP